MPAALTKDPIPDLIWMESLPRLEITYVKQERTTEGLKVEFRIQSARKLTDDDFQWFLDKELIVKGKLFIPWSTCDGSEEVAGRWTVDGNTFVPFWEYYVTSVI